MEWQGQGKGGVGEIWKRSNRKWNFIAMQIVLTRIWKKAVE